MRVSDIAVPLLQNGAVTRSSATSPRVHYCILFHWDDGDLSSFLRPRMAITRYTSSVLMRADIFTAFNR